MKAVLVWLALIGACSLAWAEEVQPRIIGGTSATPEEGEFFAILMVKYEWGDGENEFLWEPACGASYIGDGLVMTAAHCLGNLEYKIWLGDPGAKMGYESCDSSQCIVTETAPNSDEVYAALYPQYNDELHDINVSDQGRDILFHKHYDVGSFANDIALIRLDQIPSPTIVEAVSLPQSNNYPNLAFSGDDVTVIGLGDTTYNVDTFRASKDLLKVDLPAVSASACSSKYSNYDDEVMVCAGFINGLDGGVRKDSCQGDSGGPLVHNTGVDFVQYGIVSFGLSCAETYGVYADVYGLTYWIDNVKAYWLDSIDFDWNVNFGKSENSMNKTVVWTITNNSGSQIDIGTFNYNNLPTGFSPGTNQCGSTLGNGQSCSVSFNASFNSVGTYEGEVFFDVNGKEYELKFDAVVVKPSSTSSRFSGGGSFSPWWFLLVAPLVLLRRTRKGPLALALLSTLGLTACSSNPFASEPPEVVFNPTISEQGLEFSVMSNGCTQENHLLLRVKGDEVEVVRTQPDMCRAAPQLKRFVMPLPEQESVWQLENPVRYSNRVSRDAQ